ncbi:ABC transporter permease subunit [Paenibacillus sp.]|uniref:ABC transporter permease n=1 Tax=Paenibacillus sp. TaxID=58172 RepID=UPI0028119177|nr:ABC transporter permease subunit [Paenibacillus sp.]
MFRRLIKDLLRDRRLYFMLIPFVLWYIVFLYKPMYGLVIAFKDYSVFRGIADSPWVGFENFQLFFNSPYFSRTLINTVMISFYSLIFAFPAPIILALLLNEVRNRVFKRWVQTLTYLPHFISVVVVAGIVTNFLAPTTGIVNHFIALFGGERQYFLVNPDYFRTIFIGMGIWKDVGFNAIIYLAALSAVNPELYEAAVIDGANRWKQTLHITLPGIWPTVSIMLILAIGNLLDVSYETIILLYQPATYATADVISTYVYRSGIQEMKYGLSVAVGLFNSLVGFILIIAANRLSNKLTQNGLW